MKKSFNIAYGLLLLAPAFSGQCDLIWMPFYLSGLVVLAIEWKNLFYRNRERE